MLIPNELSCAMLEDLIREVRQSIAYYEAQTEGAGRYANLAEQSQLLEVYERLQARRIEQGKE